MARGKNCEFGLSLETNDNSLDLVAGISINRHMISYRKKDFIQLKNRWKMFWLEGATVVSFDVGCTSCISPSQLHSPLLPLNLAHIMLQPISGINTCITSLSLWTIVPAQLSTVSLLLNEYLAPTTPAGDRSDHFPAASRDHALIPGSPKV
jgi:hypothetical protein